MPPILVPAAKGNPLRSDPEPKPFHGELPRIYLATGVLTRIADISLTRGNTVLTVVTSDRTNVFVGNLSVLPIVPGGTVSDYATGLKTIMGLAMDKKWRLLRPGEFRRSRVPDPGRRAERPPESKGTAGSRRGRALLPHRDDARAGRESLRVEQRLRASGRRDPEVDAALRKGGER